MQTGAWVPYESIFNIAHLTLIMACEVVHKISEVLSSQFAVVSGHDEHAWKRVVPPQVLSDKSCHKPSISTCLTALTINSVARLIVIGYRMLLLIYHATLQFFLDLHPILGMLFYGSRPFIVSKVPRGLLCSCLFDCPRLLVVLCALKFLLPLQPHQSIGFSP